MKSKSYDYVSTYNSHYYKVKTKIDRQLSREIKKAKEEFSQKEFDLDNYQNVWVEYLEKFDWTSFAVLKEDLFTSNLNTKIKEINKQIKEINKSLPKECKLPLQPLRARSKKSLENYTLKYFKFLIYRKLIDRVVYTLEQDKKQMWHVHAIINLYRSDVFVDRIKEFWLLSENSYIEPIEDLQGSLIYISKSFSQLNFNKVKHLENYNFLGNFTQQINPLKPKEIEINKIIEMKNNKITKEDLDRINKLKTKMNIHVIVDAKFIENQNRINAKHNAISTDLLAIRLQRQRQAI